VTFATGLARAIARGAVLLCAGAAALLAIALEGTNAPVWWIELARYLPLPLLLPPALAALGLSLLLGRGWRVAAAAGAVLTASVVMGLEVHAGDSGHNRLRVMTYNVKAFHAEERPGGYAQLAWEIALHDPDVLFMQDAEIAEGPHQVVKAARALVAGRHVFASGQYVIASRLPLKDCRAGNISYPGHRREYLRCTVGVAGVEVDIATVHFVSPREGLNATRHERLEGIEEWRENFTDRMHQARSLAFALAGNPRPLILAGDLNAPESSPVLGTLKAIGLRDAFSAAGIGYGYTHGHSLRPGFSFLRIDHVLVSAGIGVADCFVGGSEASEHRPVIADLLLSRMR
jgi:vancomycin resistance protein VanJ